MKNKVLLLIALIALGLLSGCGQNNNQKQKEDLSEFGNYYGDSDDPADDEFVDDGDDIAIRAVLSKDPYWSVILFATTADGNQYYLYDDETDYQYSAYPYFLIRKVFYNNEDKINKWGSYLTKVYDLPKISGVPDDFKECLLKVYYDTKDKPMYIRDKGYGFQSFSIDNHFFTLQRYNKNDPKFKQLGVPSDIPDGAFMVSTY